MSRVIDPSVAVKWYLTDELSEDANRILSLVEESGAIVPALFRWEVQNVLWHAHTSGRIDAETLEDAITSLRALPIDVEDSGARLMFGSELGLARAHDLTVYDAAYLALALDRRIPLATADHALAYAARESGVAVELI